MVERADRLWQKGHRAAAFDLLREQVRRSPSEPTARLALIARYREIGAPDQAGRWGLALEGQTSPFERDRAARLLAGAGLRDRDLPGFLALPSRDLPPGVSELLPLVEHYREHFGQKSPDNEPPPPNDWREFAALALWSFSVGSAVVAVLIVWAGVVLGARMTAFARWSAVVFLGIAALGCAAQGWWRLRSGGRASGLIWLAIAVITAAALALLIAAAARNSGALLFTWER